MRQRSHKRLVRLWWYCAMRSHDADSDMDRLFKSAWDAADECLGENVLPLPESDMFWRWRAMGAKE